MAITDDQENQSEPVNVSPPVTTTETEFPFHKLEWNEFECLCRDIAQAHGFEKVHRYGKTGQIQHGIDFTGISPEGVRTAFQVKQKMELTASELEVVVQEYIKGKTESPVVGRTYRFIVCLSIEANEKKLQEKLAVLNEQHPFPIEIWDSVKLTRVLILRDQRNLVLRYFGEAWVSKFFVTPRQHLEPVVWEALISDLIKTFDRTAKVEEAERLAQTSSEEASEAYGEVAAGLRECFSGYGKLGELHGELGELLIARHPRWNEHNVFIDATHVLRDHPAEKIDVVVVSDGGQPVAVEATFGRNASQLRRQVEARLGKVVGVNSLPIETGVSVVYPDRLTSGRLEQARLRFAVHQSQPDGAATRWPERDDEWLSGTVDDLADTVELLSLSERLVREGKSRLEDGVRAGSTRLRNLAEGTDVENRIGQVLHQEPGEQTCRMAIAILTNAFIFHRAVEVRPGIPRTEALQGMGGTPSRRRVLAVWERILDVNYWPVFSIASELLTWIPERIANPVLAFVNDVASDLVDFGAVTFHDLAGRMFQTLIADRKFLATFYTLPASACLLAELAVSRLDLDWSDRDAILDLKVADFACGTGALLSAVQRAVYRRHRRTGGNDADLHQGVMERVLLGTDILPSATHLTASMLSSTHPRVPYGKSLIEALPYGIDEVLSSRRGLPPDEVYLGALDLLSKDLVQPMLGADWLDMGGLRMKDVEGLDELDLPVTDESFDLVIMNPPFTRPTNHESTAVPVPSFAGFGTSEAEQRAMSARLKAMSSSYRFGHGNAGLASNFMDIAHAKLKPGGVLALVMPFAFVVGGSWVDARQTLAELYGDVQILSIAATGSQDRAFSADTGMAECLVLARKQGEVALGSELIRFDNLTHRPRSILEATLAARNLEQQSSSFVGTIHETGAAGVRKSSLSRFMENLCRGCLALPRTDGELPIPITELDSIANRGLVDRDINGGSPRGAFDIESYPSVGKPEFPALWRHAVEAERCLKVRPDTQGIVRSGMREQAVGTWEHTASLLHSNLDFRLNSQSLAMCITPEVTLGGRAWPNVLPHREEWVWPLLLWANSTLGLMMFWWTGTRQQQSCARITISRLPELNVLDARCLSASQLQQCQAVCGEFHSLSLLPANEAYRDPVRKELDAALWDILELPHSLLSNLDLVREQWCAEPSVHGGKRTRPQGDCI